MTTNDAVNVSEVIAASMEASIRPPDINTDRTPDSPARAESAIKTSDATAVKVTTSPMPTRPDGDTPTTSNTGRIESTVIDEPSVVDVTVAPTLPPKSP